MWKWQFGWLGDRSRSMRSAIVLESAKEVAVSLSIYIDNGAIECRK
jgi:hypothetical protein